MDNSNDPRYNFYASPTVDELIARDGKGPIHDPKILLGDFWPEDEPIGVLHDKFGWDGYRLHFARLQIQKVTNRVQPTRTIDVAEDPDDNRILECAAEAGSDLIITNDQDLLRLGSHEGRPIIRAADFLNSYGPK